MQRLAGIDAAFLYLETASAHMHVTGTIVLDPATMPHGPNPERIGDYVVARLRSLELFRKRIVEIPFGLGHPVWIDAGEFDPAAHVHRATIASPATPQELARTVESIASEPLDRRRPLWELWILDGLENGHAALVVKVHHALVDGVTAAEVMSRIFELEPNDDVTRFDAETAADGRDGEPTPTSAELVSDALAWFAAAPLRMARTVVETGRSLVPMMSRRWKAASAVPTLPFNAPRTMFSGSISPQRTVAFARASLDDVHAIRAAFGVTVNDVILTACSLSLRRYLRLRDRLPRRPLVATVPVSVHGQPDEPTAANRVSVMFVSLPVDVADPIIQLMRVSRDASKAKKLQKAIGGNMLSDWVQHAPAGLVTGAARLYSSMHLADHMPPIHNLVISNIPGPPIPLYAAGARLVSAYPLGPVLEGAAVNVTAMSYGASVDLGVIACKRSVPDVWRITDGFEQAILELRAIAEMETMPLATELTASHAEPSSSVVQPARVPLALRDEVAIAAASLSAGRRSFGEHR